MAKRLPLAMPALVFLLSPAAVGASTIFATFTGTVTSVTDCPEENCQDPFGGFFMIGDAVSGGFQVELGQADLEPNDRYGYYPASNAVIQVSPDLRRTPTGQPWSRFWMAITEEVPWMNSGWRYRVA